MAIPNTRAMTRRPTHPGEMLREDFLPDYAERGWPRGSRGRLAAVRQRTAALVCFNAPLKVNGSWAQRNRMAIHTATAHGVNSPSNDKPAAPSPHS